ncbi:kinetochore Sim4 complex subunit Fta4 [Chaetomium tenue]|uniref:Kinetochore Sim4 complex subunit Fta4 n=1 Tax=Chaetomium tenue TaxID=1854479 RepID=A0ACB7PKX9_9PEZI|nr:kinetochore Sim4 complex subunit Fta4 [Chaetomium globosum]
MAPTQQPTVLTLKQTFLTAQTRLLSQPLTPTRDWHNTNNPPEETNEDPATATTAPLPPKAIDDALFKLNHRLQQHARRAYAPQATRHVAEQIEQLYWNAAEAAAERDEEEVEVEGVEVGVGVGDDDGNGEVPVQRDAALRVGADLADPGVIATLPLEWEGADAASRPLEARRYAELAGELHALAERQREAAARVARLRRMRALLQPFAADPGGDGGGGGDGEGGRLDGVQENLVTRNGEVETELHRMRMLLARVGGRVGQLKEQGPPARESSVGSLFSGGGEGMEGVEMDEQRKVGSLLERF